MFHLMKPAAIGESKMVSHTEKLLKRSLPECVGDDWPAESFCSKYWKEYFLQFWRGLCLLSDGWVGEILLFPRGLSSGLGRTERE